MKKLINTSESFLSNSSNDSFLQSKELFKKTNNQLSMRLWALLVAATAFFTLCIFLSSCKKDNIDTQVPVVVSSISPTSGPYSTIVTITGTGFSTSLAGNTVKFNGVTATVQNATATQLQVTVPQRAGTGAVTVQSGSMQATGPTFSFVNTITASTLGGNGTPGFADGNAGASEFYAPMGVCVDAAGNAYVADYDNSRLRKITPAGVASTIAGNGTAGFADGNAATAEFKGIASVAVAATGNIYVADRLNNRIRKITPAGVVSTFAGNGTIGYVDGNAATAEFGNPYGVALDANENVYVADFGNNRIRKITQSGIVSTLAGNGTAGFADGDALTSKFSGPVSLVVDASGNVYVADALNNRIRKITSSGVVSTLAGNGTIGYVDGNAAAAEFDIPTGVALDASGNVYVADYVSNRIRQVTTAGVVNTIAGNGIGGFADGNGANAEFYYPFGVAVDTGGNIYIGDYANNRVRKITIQ